MNIGVVHCERNIRMLKVACNYIFQGQKSENAQHLQRVLCELDKDAWGTNLKMAIFHHFLCLSEAKGMSINLKMLRMFS